MAVLIPNPCIKKRNLAWSLESPASSQDAHAATSPSLPTSAIATTAEIESGATQISDHLAQFTSTLSSRLCPTPALIPRLSISDYASLYQSCAGSQSGAHFVIHQHDHPVAGTHYDLRLQINETSSVSWAIMYGLPGDANSSRLNRNATETRIHSLWNHLIETASAETGSLMIWDTGTYSVLARRSKHAPAEDPSSPPGSSSSSSSSNNKQHAPTAQSLLLSAFQNRKIRLRLHGTKLPDPYVINIRLTKTEDAAGRSRRSRKRRIRRPAEPDSDDYGTSNSQDSANDEPQSETDNNDTSRRKQQQEEKDAQVRLTNAYHGASNTIGSVYQRRWYLSLDRRACGFTEKRRHGRRVWERPPDFEEAKPEESESSCRLSFPFYVCGPRFERSVVTGRLGEQVLRDEGVTTFVPRKGWTPVMK